MENNFIPLCMIPFIANMMNHSNNEEPQPGPGPAETSFVFKEMKKYLGINFGTNRVAGTTQIIFECGLISDFYSQFEDDYGEWDEAKWEVYEAAHKAEFDNTTAHVQLINYDGTSVENAHWEFDAPLFTDFTEGCLEAVDDGNHSILGSASCFYNAEGPGAGDLTGYDALKVMAAQVSACDFIVTIDGNSFIVPAYIVHDEIN